jgi:hypothetical protein
VKCFCNHFQVTDVTAERRKEGIFFTQAERLIFLSDATSTEYETG